MFQCPCPHTLGTPYLSTDVTHLGRAFMHPDPTTVLLRRGEAGHLPLAELYMCAAVCTTGAVGKGEKNKTPPNQTKASSTQAEARQPGCIFILFS